MLPLTEAELDKSYILVSLDQQEEAGKHLANLGFAKGTEIRIMSHTESDYIVLLRSSRVAINKDVAATIKVREKTAEDSRDWVPLDTLKVGQHTHVTGILGQGAVKRRLMDMGLTKGVDVLIRKVAPLGDPIEINIRGYELTLRKQEAGMVLVESVEE